MHQDQVEDNEEEKPQDSEQENNGQSEEIAEVEQSSTSSSVESEADSLFEDKPLSEKLSAGFSQFELLVHK